MRFTLRALFVLLLTVASAARATAPTCVGKALTRNCGGDATALKGTADIGKGLCTGAPTDCGPQSPYSGQEN
jgi:hypothetical protein